MVTDTPFAPEDIDSMLDAIRTAVAVDDPETALHLSDAALAMSPDHLDTLLVKARVLHDLGRPQDARGVLEAAAAHHGDMGVVWRQLGDAALECGDGERAAEAYRQWQRLGGPTAATETALAIACLVDLDRDRARRHIDAAIAAGGTELTADVAVMLRDVDDRADVEAAAGWLLCSLGAVGPAIDLLRASLEHKELPSTHRRLGIALLADRGSDDAVRHLEAAVEQSPNDHGWRVELATAQLAAGDVAAAATSFEAVLTAAPDNVAAAVGSGRVAISRDDPSHALRIADQLLDRDPGSADAWMLRAEALTASGRHPDALVSAEHAIVATPDDRSPWLLAADAADAAKRPDVARHYRGRATIQLSASLGVAEGPDEAAADLGAELHELDRLVVADPRIRSIYAHRAVIADRLFLPRRALGYLDAAIDRGVIELTADVECDRGDLLQSIGDVAGAAAAYERAIASDQACERARIGRLGVADAARVDSAPIAEPRTPAPAPAPAPEWTATHRAPPPGLAAYAAPTHEQSSVAQLDGSLPVEQLEESGPWSHVRCENGWECWVTTRLLVPSGTPWRPSHRVPATGLIAYAAPSSTPEQAGRIDPGLRVELLGEYGGWAHVRFENDWSCWVNRAALEALA